MTTRIARLPGLRSLVLIGVLAGAACDNVTSESIQRWKTTEKGPGKLVNALGDSAVPPNLRAEAAAALVDLGRDDQVDDILGRIPAGERAEILKTLIPSYTEGMKSSDVPQARAARDALFSVRAYATPEQQREIDAALVPSIVKDVREGRLSGGRQPLEKMVPALGPPMAKALAALIDDPRVPYLGAADLLARGADEATRDEAGYALVKRAVASPEIPVALWRALGTMGGKPAIAFLTQKAEKGSERDAVDAVQALQQRRDPSLLPFALRMAGDGKANKAVRDEMFGLVEKIGGAEAQQGLVRIIASDPNELVRYRAYEAALAVGGGDAVVPALEAFPAAATYKKDDVMDFLVKDVTKVGPSAKPAVLKALASPRPLVRMTAVLSFEAPLPSDPHKSFGLPTDAAFVARLSSDRGTLKGFPVGDTVGREAARVAAVLQKKSGP